MKGFVAGVVVTLFLFLVGAYIYISYGCMPANADAKPGSLERWMARTSLKASLQRDAPKGPAPVALTDENLISGIKLYAVNCAVCHGASDAQASNIAVGLFQHAPQFGKDGVEDDPEGKIYWLIKHGIRLTGMPSFSGTLKEDQLWQVTLFLKHMNALPTKADRAWIAVASAKK
ncbi:MAG TPA: cytochrome c [bacterium]